MNIFFKFLVVNPFSAWVEYELVEISFSNFMCFLLKNILYIFSIFFISKRFIIHNVFYIIYILYFVIFKEFLKKHYFNLIADQYIGQLVPKKLKDCFSCTCVFYWKKLYCCANRVHWSGFSDLLYTCTVQVKFISNDLDLMILVLTCNVIL